LTKYLRSCCGDPSMALYPARCPHAGSHVEDKA
jgi:hypothetical protein